MSGTRSAPKAHFVRFTDEQDARLKAAARSRGCPITTILREGAMIRIEQIEEEERGRRSEREKRIADRKGALRAPAASSGLGIDFSRRSEPQSEPPPVDAPVVLVQTLAQQQAATAPVPRSTVADLAKFVANGPEWSRAERLRSAVAIISSSTEDQAERDRLASQLDERIGELLRQPSAESAPLSWLRKVISP